MNDAPGGSNRLMNPAHGLMRPGCPDLEKVKGLMWEAKPRGLRLAPSAPKEK